MAQIAEGQIHWDGDPLFDGRVLALTEIEGWDDLPDVDSGNVSRSSRHGAWAGRSLAQQRTVTATGVVVAGGGLHRLDDHLDRIRRATAVRDDARERPLTARIGGRTLTAYGQVAARSIPGGAAYQAGRPVVSLQWTCADPRRYGRERTAVVKAPVSIEGGLEYPLAYPLDYGAAAAGGAVTVLNAGDAEAHPRIDISGPCDRPRVVNTDSGHVMEFAIALTAGDVLTVDCEVGTVLLNGADRFYTLTPRSVPPEAWTIPPGRSAVGFRGIPADPDARVRIGWRDAYM